MKIWKKAADLGFIGIQFPEKYSGQGLGVLENILVAEEFCSGDSSIGSALILSSFASECILRFGSNELKEKFLPLVKNVRVPSSHLIGKEGRGFYQALEFFDESRILSHKNRACKACNL